MFQKVDVYFETVMYSRVTTEGQGKNASHGIQDSKRQKYGWDMLPSFSFLCTSL